MKIYLADLLFFASCILINCHNNEPISVAWKVISIEPALEIIPLRGTFISDKLLSLSFLKDGMISTCKKADGTTVKKGDTLATLENKDAWNIVAQCRADVAMATITLNQLITTDRSISEQKLLQKKIIETSFEKKVERAEAMLPQGSITQADFDELKKEYELARSERKVAESEFEAHVNSEPKLQQSRIEKSRILLEDALIALTRTIITAPSSGEIVKTHYKPGEMYIAGTPCITFLTLDTSVTFVLELPFALRDEIAKGQRVILYDTATNTRIGDAVVSTIVPAMDSTSNIIRIGISSRNASVSLISDHNLSIGLVMDTLPEAITIEKKFLIGKESNGAVFIKHGNRADRRAVMVSYAENGSYIIKKGLNPDDTILLPRQLEQNSLVRLK